LHASILAHYLSHSLKAYNDWIKRFSVSGKIASPSGCLRFRYASLLNHRPDS
jgi:hypothetical protein